MKKYFAIAIAFLAGGAMGAATSGSPLATLIASVTGVAFILFIGYNLTRRSPVQSIIPEELRVYDANQRAAHDGTPQRYTVIADGALMLSTHDVEQANRTYDDYKKLSPRSSLELKHAGNILRQNY